MVGSVVSFTLENTISIKTNYEYQTIMIFYIFYEWGDGSEESDSHHNFKAIKAMKIVLRWKILCRPHKIITSSQVKITSRTANNFQIKFHDLANLLECSKKVKKVKRTRGLSPHPTTRLPHHHPLPLSHSSPPCTFPISKLLLFSKSEL